MGKRAAREGASTNRWPVTIVGSPSPASFYSGPRACLGRDEDDAFAAPRHRRD
jgi:hypothetical protein